MKIRIGFVSNSSSSSFVIHKSYLSKKQLDELEALYTRLADNKELYDDSGTYFTNEENYVSFNAYGGSGYKELISFLDKIGITGNKIYREGH